LSENNIGRLAANNSLLSQESHLFHLARTGHLRLPHSWLAKYPLLIDKALYPTALLLFAYLAPLLSAVLGFPLQAVALFLPGIQQSAAGLFLLLIASFLPLFFLVWLWLLIVEQRPLWTTGMERPLLRKYLRGLGVGLLMFTAAIIALALIDTVVTETAVAERLTPVAVGGTLLIFLGWMVQGAAEEVLARGLLLPALGVRWGPLAGVLVSSLFFALLHLSNPHLSLISLVNLGLFGVFASLYALFEGGLWGIFAIHAVWNWAQGNLFGFPVSGLDSSAGILLDLMEVGPDWLTGGPFGPEGGLAVTFVLLISSLLLWFAGRRRRNQTESKNRG
jgi:membrane protease YdiL (CAAX protease family)